MIFFAALYKINKAIAKIKPPSKNPDNSSYFPCPKGWSSSAGLEDFFTITNAINDAAISLRECKASDIMLKLPVKNPTVSLIVMRRAFEHTDRNAPNCFSFVVSIISIFVLPKLFALQRALYT